MAKIIAEEGGKNESQPGKPDRFFPEVSQVGIEGFAAGYSENHRTKDHERMEFVGNEEMVGMEGVNGQ